MDSLNDFVDHRWADAKEALRALDPDFVDEREKTVWIQDLGLQPPWPVQVGRQPGKRLSREWHNLLESCCELIFQASIVQTAGHNLTAEANRGLPSDEIGRQSDYNFRSWFIHANTLCERTEDVIRKTTAVHINDQTMRRSIARRYQQQVKEIQERVKRQRNEYAHGARVSWVRGITEDQLWEGLVAIGLSPQRIYADHVYPDAGTGVLEGKRARFLSLSEELCSILGEILQRLEAEVKAL